MAERPLRKPLVVRPAQGRRYEMDRMRAIFLADEKETDSRYSISEWWLQLRTRVQVLTRTQTITSSTCWREQSAC